MSSPEQLPNSGERGLEAAGDAARERANELLQSPETSAEHPENNGESENSARKEAFDAISKEAPGHEQAAAASQTHRVKPVASRQARAKAYNDIMHHTQNELPPASRAFSKAIHQPAVEKASTIIGATVARPNIIFFGGLFALIIGGVTYLIAKYYGYRLSGFEIIGAFVLGGIIGALVDFIRLATRKH